MIITKAELKDARECAEILDIGRNNIRKYGIDQWQDGYPNIDNVIEDINNDVLYVIKDGDEIVGLTALVSEDEYYDAVEEIWNDHSSYIAAHRVAVKYNDRHLGTFLFTELKKMYNHIKVDTHEGNRAMNACLKKNGFDFVGVIKIKDGALRNAYEYSKRD